MKRKFTFLIAAALMLLTMVASTGTMWGQSRAVSSLIFTAACGGSGTADDGAEWTVTSDASESNFDNTSGIHYGTNNASVTYVQLATDDISGTISQVVVNCRDARATATVSVTVGGNAFTYSGGETATATNTSADYTFTGSESGEIIVRIDRGTANTKAIYVKSVIVTYTTGGSTTPTTVTIDASGITNTDVYVSTAAGSLSATVKDNEENVIGGATVTWTSSTPGVANINENGVVTLVAAGTTTITASYAGDVTYGASSNTYELTVTSSAPYVQPNPVVINMNYQWLGSTNGGNLNANQLPVVKVDDNVTTTITDGTSTRPRGDADYIRIYNGSTLTFDAPDGYLMSSIVFTTGGNNTWNAPTASTGTLSSKTWTGQAESIVFTLSGTCFISSVSITLSDLSTVSTPTITPNGGNFVNSQEVTLACSTDGATIYYTTNGETPTTSSTEYTEAFTINATCTVKAIAAKNGMTTSEVASAEFTKVTPMTVAAALAASATNGVFVQGIISQIDDVNTQYHNATYWISDDGTTTGQMKVYRGRYLNNADFTSEGQILVGDAVVVTGNLTTYEEVNQLAQGNYLISLVRPEKVATPTFNPEAGTYTSAQNVTITCATEQANIFYKLTENGDWTEYTAAIPVATTTTIWAKATKEGMVDSDVASAAYVINTEPTITVDPAIVNAPYAGADGTLTVTYENITEILAEVWFCNAEGTAGATYDWITADINAQNNVAYLVEENDGAARTAYFKVYALDDEANNVYSNLVTVTQAAFVVDYATIPFSYNGNGGSPLPTGMTNHGVGNYDESTMKFDGTGDYILIKYGSEANKLRYSIKGNGFSGGTFDVLESVDGTNYDAVKSYTSLSSNTVDESLSISSNSRYIKFIYTNKSSGNVALSAISIKNVPAPIDSWKLNNETITANTITIGESYTLPTFVTNSDGTKTYTSSNTDVATINPLTGVINVLTAGNTTIKCATAETTNYLASEKSYILTVNPGATYTVTYHSNGEETIVTDVPAGNLNLTAPINIPNGYDYVGWATTTIDGTSTSTTFFTSYNLTANTDLYAVFAMESYEAITSAPTDGTYVLAYKKSSNEYKVLNGIGSGNTTYGTAATVEEITPATIGNNVINLAATANNGYYSMKFGEYYLGWQSGNSLQFSDEFSADNYEWSYEISGENVVIINKKDTNRKLQYNAQNSRFACYTSAQAPVMLFRSVNIYCTSVSPAPITVNGNGEMTGNTTISSGSAYTITTPVTVPDGLTLTVNGTLGNDVPANLIIEDGGQVIVNNTGVQATFKKSVAHGGAKDAANWYTISSPVNNIATASVNNLIQDPATKYDLYYYDEATQMWKNHKANAITNMTNGRGYLYWNTDGDELSFPGELNSGNVEIAVTTTGTGDLAGFNLIGNPYSHNIYKGDGTAIPNSILSAGYYTLSNAGAWTAGTDNTTAIKPGQGILVKATAAGTVTMTNTTANGAKRNNEFIKFMIANSQYEDVAYALFNEEEGLNKINHRNADIPMLYIPQDGQNYAIATMSDETQSFNLNFKAMTTGQYTLSFKAEGKYDYLHVIDRMTGEDIDMLLDGEYSFIASPSDNDARFIVKLGYNTNNSAENDIFAYQNNNDIIVNGEGELQVFDVTGRMVATQHVNGVQTVNVPSQGVFIFKLNEKTQKIVVR